MNKINIIFTFLIFLCIALLIAAPFIDSMFINKKNTIDNKTVEYNIDTSKIESRLNDLNTKIDIVLNKVIYLENKIDSVNRYNNFNKIQMQLEFDDLNNEISEIKN